MTQHKPRTIYALTTAFDEYRPRYVGTTIASPQRRLSQHLRDSKRFGAWRVYRWIRARVAAGHEIIMLCLERNAPNPQVETLWIKAMRARGGVLMNSITGGNAQLPGGKLTAEHRAKISEGLAKVPHLLGHWKGVAMSDERKAAISKGLLASGRDYTEQAKKTAIKLTGRKLSPEHVASLRAAIRPGWSDAQHAKFAITNASPEVKEKRRKAAQARASSPEERAALAERGRLGRAKRWGCPQAELELK